MLKNIIIVAVGGAFGSVARYLLSGAVKGTVLSNFPFGTLAANVLGCFLIGVMCGLPEGGVAVGREARLLLVAGFCGGFTTFSTFMNESVSLMRADSVGMAFVYICVSVVMGLAAVFLGMQITKLI